MNAGQSDIKWGKSHYQWIKCDVYKGENYWGPNEKRKVGADCILAWGEK